MIPRPRTAPDNLDAAVHAFVAESFREQARHAKSQAKFLLTLQTTAGNDSATFQAAVATRLGHLADTEQQLADQAKDTAR